MARSYFKQEHDLGMYSVLIDACYFHFYFFIFLWWPIMDAYCEEFGTDKMCVISVVKIRSLSLVILWFADKRRAEAARIREKYPDRIPVRISRFFYPFHLCFSYTVLPVLILSYMCALHFFLFYQNGLNLRQCAFSNCTTGLCHVLVSVLSFMIIKMFNEVVKIMNFTTWTGFGTGTCVFSLMCWVFFFLSSQFYYLMP